MYSNVSIWLRLRRTPYQTVASLFMMFITLFVLGLFLLLVGSTTALVGYFESKPQLTVFFANDKDKASIDQLSEKLKSMGKVLSTKYVSKEEALSIYREQNKEDPLLLEMVTADILPASLDVSATSPKFLNEIYQMVRTEAGVEDVVFQKEVVDTLINWASTVRKVGFLFVTFLILSTFFILLTSISMKIANKKDEIEILKLVGATNWYVKKPFIKEGVIYGLSGATFAWIFIFFLVLYLEPYMDSFLKGIGNLNLLSFGSLKLAVWPLNFPLFLLLYLLLLMSGLGIGFIGSLFASNRYLND